MSSNPYQITRQLESELCNYTGAPFAVCVGSCSVALQLALMRVVQPRYCNTITIPKRTYVSVPMAIKLAGFYVGWRDEDWRGAYKLAPYPIWDCARRFTSGMYVPGQFQCLSFSSSKILGIEQGGCILHDDPEADDWFRRARFDGRTEEVSTHDDNFDIVGLHAIMLPSIAAQLVLKLHHLPKHNEDLPRISYPDLSKHKAFQ